MARASTPTKLSLDKWAKIVGINPLHFNQVVVPERPPTVCSQPWLTHAWQGVDKVGREDLAIAIRQAEDRIENELKSRLLPTWEVDEWRPTMRYKQPELVRFSVQDVRGFGQVAFARWGHMITGGIQAKTLVDEDAAIVYTDEDGDGYEETATVLATGVTSEDPCEIAVYYPDKAGDDTWEIRPINVSINTTTDIATITFRREQAVLEDLQESQTAEDVDAANDANFLTVVDVYRRYNDPQQQVQMLWELPVGICVSCGSSGSGCPECAYNTQYGCLMTRNDPRQSIVVYRPAEWNETTLEFDTAAFAVSRQPDLVRLWYYAGLRDKTMSCNTRNMPLVWERAVAFFAASLLDRPMCECNNIHAYIEQWRKDLAISGEEGQSLDDDLLGNPFGTKRGAVHAWQQVMGTRDAVQEIAV